MCVGVATVETQDGVKEGRRAKPFDYSPKVLLSRKDYEARIQKEIARVKKLSVAGGWVKNNRTDGTLYLDDKLTEIPGVGPKTQENFRTAEIETVGDLLTFEGAIKGLSKARLTALKEVAKTVIHTNKPDDLELDHKAQSNPYLARYRSEW